MIIDIVNEFREANGKGRILGWSSIENDHCLQHCVYMAGAGYLDHAPRHFLKDKAETIAMCNFRSSVETTVRYLICEVIASSKEHRDVVLNYDNLSYGFYLYDYTAYLTIRGWN